MLWGGRRTSTKSVSQPHFLPSSPPSAHTQLVVPTLAPQVLSLTKEASQADVKKAYYRLALQLHPDKNPGDEVGWVCLVQPALL